MRKLFLVAIPFALGVGCVFNPQPDPPGVESSAGNGDYAGAGGNTATTSTGTSSSGTTTTSGTSSGSGGGSATGAAGPCRACLHGPCQPRARREDTYHVVAAKRFLSSHAPVSPPAGGGFPPRAAARRRTTARRVRPGLAISRQPGRIHPAACLEGPYSSCAGLAKRSFSTSAAAPWAQTSSPQACQINGVVSRRKGRTLS